MAEEKSKYEEYTKEELLKLVKNQEDELKIKKYGLSWDSEKEREQVVLDCENNIPILKKVKEISTDNSEDNILIEGDNYHALTCLNYTHKGKIDVIYIDPPYNTEKEGFVYNDKRVDVNDGYRHSKWLNFMEKRLKLAKNLLKDSGAIFISIDFNEFAQLKLLCDSIFGEVNFLGEITRKQSSGSKNDTGEDKLITNVDKILIYSKESFKFIPISQLNEKKYPLEDKNGNYATRALEMQGGDDTLNLRPKMGYSVYYHKKTEDLIIEFDYSLKSEEVYSLPNPVLLKRGYECYRPRKRGNKFGIWRWGKETFIEEFEEGNILFQEGRVFEKERKKDYLEKYPDSLCLDYINTQGTLEANAIFGDKRFSFPKPVGLMKYILKISTNKQSTILDFFAGSGTMAQAVIELNKEDGGNRKFIVCTNNEVGDKEEANFCEKYGIDKEELKKWKKDNKKEWLVWCDKFGICSRTTYPRIYNVINGYNFEGMDKQPLFEKEIGFNHLKNISLILDEIEEIISLNKLKFEKIEKKIENNIVKVFGTKTIRGKKEGLGGNLQYYKTDLIPVERIDKIKDKQRRKLTEEAGQMIAIKEGTFEELEANEYYQIFENKGKTKKTAIYFREDMDKFEELLKKIGKADAILYVFSYGRIDKKLFKHLGKNISIEDIPEPILEIYKEINQTIRKK